VVSLQATIYYFSATGNSLQTAIDIKAALKNCKLVSIPKKIDDSLICESDVIGFVFPVFALGPPNMVKRFIKKLTVNPKAYFFTVVTCGLASGNAICIVDKLLREKGVKLHFGKSLRMVANNIALYDVKINQVNRKLKAAEKKLVPIIKSIQGKEVAKIKPFSYFSEFFHRRLTPGYFNKDQYLSVSSFCSLCGICQSVCPARNIEILNNTIHFKHRCEHCLACIHWCPNKAINYKNKTKKRQRYHHPKVSSSQLTP